jgi:hypothetical protein
MAVALASILSARRTAAQRLSDSRVAVAKVGETVIAPANIAHLPDSSLYGRLHRYPLWSAPIASAFIPGLGQARLGQERFIAYMALETYLLVEIIKNSGEERDNSSTYRAIARDVARRGFPGSHPDGEWRYYETMEKYDASGSFSLNLGGPTVPETDAQTFNGIQWILARERYGIPLDDPNPAARATYAEAVTYYEQRAIPQNFGWNWLNASLEKDLFVQAINRRNDAARRVTNNLIVLIANHIVSSIDAFSSVRLIQSNGAFRATASIPLR